MMSWLKRFGLFWYDFVVGDDWRLAVGVVAALLVGAGLDRLNIAINWLAVPVIIVITLVASLRRSAPKQQNKEPEEHVS